MPRRTPPLRDNHPMPQEEPIKIYTDGACTGNPGPGGWGAVLLWKDHRRELSGGEPRTTNNRMELTAVIRALEALKTLGERPVEIFCDSQYVVRGITEWLPGWRELGWRRKTGVLENAGLWRQLARLTDGLDLHWNWVRGHSGNTHNEEAHLLASGGIPVKRSTGKPPAS